MRRFFLVFLGTLLISACATTGQKFNKIYPGMSSQQVAEAMGRGPTQVESFEDHYTAWYYGEDYCVLLHNDKVVNISRSETGDELYAPGVGSYKTIKKALCVPPGSDRQPRIERKITTPYGTVEKSDAL